MGAALLSVVLLLALTSALLIGFVTLISSDQQSAFSNRDQTLAYGAAHAGLERLTDKLGKLFDDNFNPTSAQINALMTTPPDLRDANNNKYVTFTLPGNTPVANDTSGYRVLFTDSGGYPAPETNPRSIASGPYYGLLGRATPYVIDVTARTFGGAEVHVRRKMQTMLIPAFQFGVFSEVPLAFHSGTDFTFGGRVHTNSDLYLAEGDSNVLTLADKVTAVGQVIRTRLPNNVVAASNGWSGAIWIPNSGKTLASNEGSQVDGLNSANNDPTWTNAVARLNRAIINGRNGAVRLDLPLVQLGAKPIDLLRRPRTTETTTDDIYQQRYFSKASLRILLSDNASEISNLPGVTATAPVNLETLKIGGGVAWFSVAPGQAPAATTPSTIAAAYSATDGYWSQASNPILRGYIKIEKQSTTGVWSDVTQEILTLGFTGRRLSNNNTFDNAPATGSAPPCTDISSDAIIRLQRLKDEAPSSAAVNKSEWITGALGTTTVSSCGLVATAFTSGSTTIPIGTPLAKGDYFWENALYDAREGAYRDTNQTGVSTLFLGGVMHYVELDVANIVRWLNGSIGSSGTNVENSDGGYVVYISDRRTNKDGLNTATPVAPYGNETGEYGSEDVVNLAVTAGYPGNGTLDTGEDLNDNLVLDTYGQYPYPITNPRTGLPTPTGASNPVGNWNIRPWHMITAREARSNPPLYFRRAVKLINGADATGSTLRNLPGTYGLMIVSENPVYVQGNYNTGAAWTSGTTNHRGAAIIADSVTLLSGNWNDIRSFVSPHNPTGRDAAASWYRMAVVSGKVKFFPKQSWGSADSGADGGVHNFLKYLEDWYQGGSQITVHYKGSLVSFYYSRQAVGTFKYINSGSYTGAPVYIAPDREFSFDSEFLTWGLLPPKPPSFRDLNTLTFREILRPGQ